MLLLLYVISIFLERKGCINIKAINKVIAYSTSSLWLAIIIVLSINYKIFEETIFWTISLTMALPIGIVLECLYSTIYWILVKIVERIAQYKYTSWIHLSHFLAIKKYDNYKKYHTEIKNKKIINEERFQQLLSENNIIRNLWISSVIGFVFILIYLNSSFSSTIYETRILIWLPISILFILLRNLRKIL